MADVIVAARPDKDTPTFSIDGLTEKQKQTALDRYDAITPLLNRGSFGSTEVQLRAEQVGVDPSTLYRWLKRFTAHDDVTSLVPYKRGWKPGRTRIPTFSEEVLTKVIEDFYLTRLRPTVARTIREVERKCEERQIRAPSASTIRARIGRIDEAERLRRRGQREKARNKYSAVPGHFPNADFPLAVVQIDHTEADLILVDDIERLPIGRPWITVAIDVYSRVITGFYLSFDAPSVTSVAMCVARSILPKEEWLAQCSVDADWPVWGFPEMFHVDNGPEFRSKDFQNSCAMHGINVEYRPRKTPRYGAHIERLIGTIMTDLPGLPGATFSSVSARGEADPEKSAALTKSEFERWLLTLICKEYHLKIHSTIQSTPLDRWIAATVGTNSVPGCGVPERPKRQEKLQRDFLPAFHRTVQRFGVRIDNLIYFADLLRQWIKTPDPKDPTKVRKFTFRKDPRDVSKIWFYEPELKEYFVIPTADQSMPQMSIWEFRRARKHLANQGIMRATPSQLARAFGERRAIEEQAKGSTKRAKVARRSRQRRADHRAATSTVGGASNKDKPSKRVESANLQFEPVDAFEDIG